MSDGTTGSNGRGFDALRIPIVRNFALGRIFSGLSQQIVSVTVGWELYDRTGDPWVLGLVGIFTLAPSLLLMLPAGNWADVYPRRNLAIFAGLLTAIASVALGVISWQQGPVELVLATLMLFGAARAISAPAAGSILPQLIDSRLFANVNTWLISSQQIASVVGPTVGGVLIALSNDAMTSYVVAAILQFLFVGLLATLPSVAPPKGAKRTLSDIFAGFAFMWRTPIFLAAITLDLFAVLLGGAVALMPVYARDVLMVGPEGLGIMRAAPGVGAMLVMMLLTRMPPWQRPGRVLLVVVAGFGLATIGFGLSTNLLFSLACLFMIGATDSVSMVIRQTLMQALTPDDLRGRVSSVNYLFIGFSNELGAAESGAVAKLFGPIFAVVSGGVGTLIVVSIVAMKWRVLLNVPPLHTLSPETVVAEAAPEPAREPAGAQAGAS
ncbi:MAG: MFS transporter [Chloroflexi bacterium]|nr:MFS transporter [Chloroflexota bacterium]